MKLSQKYNIFRKGESFKEECAGGNGKPVSRMPENPEDLITSQYWKQIEDSGVNNMIDVNAAWDRIMKEIKGSIKPQPRIIILNNTLFRVAAFILLTIGLGTAAIYMAERYRAGKSIIIATGDNDRNKEVLLSDGSIVWLNHNSELSYPQNFQRNTRNVKLSGEGFFEVLPDSRRRPFVVSAGKAEVTVLGTSFNVITSNDSGAVEVYVEKGSVLLSGKNGGIMLETGFVGITGENTINKSLNDNRNYLAWRTGMLIYENTKLSDLFSDLKKIYNIEIYTADPSVSGKTITATFDNEQPETIIRIICSTFNLDYVRDGSYYFLSPK